MTRKKTVALFFLFEISSENIKNNGIGEVRKKEIYTKYGANTWYKSDWRCPSHLTIDISLLLYYLISFTKSSDRRTDLGVSHSICILQYWPDQTKKMIIVKKYLPNAMLASSADEHSRLHKPLPYTSFSSKKLLNFCLINSWLVETVHRITFRLH